MSNAPDFEEKARELWYSLRTDTVQAVPAIAAALRREREDALERAAQTVEKRAVLYDADMANSLRVAASYIRTLAFPAAAPAWMPPRDAMTGMTAAGEVRAAGIDVLRGVRPAAAPAGQPGTCANFWHPGNGHEIHARREAVGDLSAVHADYVNDAGCLNWKPAAAPAAEEPLGFCDWPGFKDHPHKKQEDHGRSDAEGNPLGCKNWRPAPPSAPVAPEKKPFACGADIERDGHLYRCDRGAGHAGSHGERDYAEWTDAEHHDGEPAAPSLLPRVLAVLESVGRGVVLDRRGAIELAAELRRYIAGVGAGMQPDTGGHTDACATYVTSLRSGLEREIARRNADIDEVRTSLIHAYKNREWGTIRSVLAKLAARGAARSEGET